MGQSSLESTNTSAKHSDGGILGGVGDFFHAAAYGAIQSPIDGVTQIVDHLSPVDLPHLQLIDAPDQNSLWTSAGKIAGTVVDFALLQKGLGAVAPGMFGEAAATPAWLRSGLTGGAFQMVMPTSNDGNYFANKARDLGIGFGSFAAMGAISQWVAPKLGASLVGKVEAGAEGGFAGGATDAALTDALYAEKPSVKDLEKIANFTAFGAVLGATDYLGDDLSAKWKASQIHRSVETNKGIFNDADSEVVPVQKQLYDVRFRKVTAERGEKVPTLENPGGEKVEQGHWVAQRLDDEGKPVYERGQLNQWPIEQKKIPKTYNVDADTVSSQNEFVAPTRVDGPPVHVVQLTDPVKLHTSWGSMKGKPGDWLANYDYDPATKTPGTDYAIISAPSFKQTYKTAG